MTAATLRYGQSDRLVLDVPPDRLVASCGLPTSPPLDDVAQATADALAAPLDYPPLAQLVVPGDKVCVALADGVPQAAAVVSVVIDRLLAAGVSAHDITLILGSAAALPEAADGPAGMFDAGGAKVHLRTHDAADRKQLAYLAASAEGKPIYIDRGLADADLVIPIGCQRLDAALGFFGLNSGLFPTFSDAKNLERYRAPLAAHSPVQLRRMRDEADQVSWLLGVHFLVQLIPAGDDGLLAVLAGRTAAVDCAARERCLEAWKSSVPLRAGLVVAALSGPASEQTWLNVARAMAAALRLVEEGGAIAVCSELREAAGPAVRWLASTESPATALREIVRERPVDALAAAQLVEAVGRCRVYLLSGLPAATVEDLGLTPIDGAQQLQRLVAQQPSCILLANAQYAIATPEGEDDEASNTASDRSRANRE
ncbi:MAG TPA: lactate racemase domain-containing protein [Pirellulales bacterium]|jgi:nickel-dependent lactate racemase|nr:lactate racemase domain-containing protein [Pirellulales bacterium]